MKKAIWATLIAFMMLAFPGAAQNLTQPGSANCASFIRDQQSVAFQSYLQGYMDAATSSPGYQLTDDAKSALFRSVVDWCMSRPSDGFAVAVRASIRPQSATIIPAPIPVVQPTSCRVGSTNACTGCSISCAAGSQATCQQGTDSASGDYCAFQSSCSCR